MTIGTVAIAIATVVYGVVSIFQYGEMRHDAVVSERAWVGPINAGIKPRTTKAGTYFKVPFSNHGQTPALNVRSWIGYTNNERQIPKRDPIGNSQSANMVLFPNELGNTSTMDNLLPADDVNAIKAGALILYVYGTIAYDDAFGHRHWTQFCFIPNRVWGAFAPCREHNGTDNESE